MGRPKVTVLPETVEPQERLTPNTRGECPKERPCPHLTCLYHLAYDVNTCGNVVKTFTSLDWDELPETCALDVADQGKHTLQEVGDIMNITRERVRQIEQSALKKIGKNRGYIEVLRLIQNG